MDGPKVPDSVPCVPPTDDFAHAVAADPVDLETAVLCIGACGAPEADIDAARRHLDELAAAVPEPSVEALVETLFGPDGFRGDRAEYYHPSNSFLHAVLERRRGIPITLSILAMCVGDRIGVTLQGVGTPAHFVLSTDGAGLEPGAPDDRRYIDAFNGGSIVDRDGLVAQFAALAPGVDITPYLSPLATHDVIRRVLNNLVHVYRSTGDRNGLVWSTRLRTTVPGAGAGDHRAHAGALAAAGDFGRAAAVLDRLAALGSARAEDELRHEADRLRARLN